MVFFSGRLCVPTYVVLCHDSLLWKLLPKGPERTSWPCCFSSMCNGMYSCIVDRSNCSSTLACLSLCQICYHLHTPVLIHEGVAYIKAVSKSIPLGGGPFRLEAKGNLNWEREVLCTRIFSTEKVKLKCLRYFKLLKILIPQFILFCCGHEQEMPPLLGRVMCTHYTDGKCLI